MPSRWAKAAVAQGILPVVALVVVRLVARAMVKAVAQEIKFLSFSPRARALWRCPVPFRWENAATAR